MTTPRPFVLTTRAGLIFLGLTALLSLVFATRTRPSVVTPRLSWTSAAPEGLGDLARVDRGARVRVSSWDLHRRLHPLFAIDAEPAPTVGEGWAPEPEDPAPWLEVLLPRPANVQSVVLTFVPPGESGRVPPYDLSCISGNTTVASWSSTDVGHEVTRCAGVDQIRLELFIGPGREVRLFEIEVWGT